jgi:HD-GYP domain-containing protein (c-di-GMP phosphodiesterase class II)
MLRKISVPDLQVGMYVARLDRPWLETPFLFQGFFVSGQEDIDVLKGYCVYVFVDPEKTPVSEQKIDSLISPSKKTSRKSLPDRSCDYEEKHKVEEEIEFAKQIHLSLNQHYRQLVDEVKEGNKLDISKVKTSLHEMVNSVIRNPDALLLLSRLRALDSYTYKHSIHSSILAVTFGRHLGLNIDELKDLALGVLMCDIGKVKLPRALLKKPGRLSDEEFKLIKRHVDFSIEIVEQAGKPSREVIKTIRFHHERHNGRGYPQGLAGQQIPVFARIASIVDCYDAITTKRTYHDAMDNLEAIRCMYEWRDIDFQAELVEEFIQCLGVFPTGTIVELSTGEVGIVLAQNRTRRLRPRVMLVLDSEHVALDHFPVVDLSTEWENKDGKTIEIVTTHEPGAYGIDPSEFFL